MENDTVFGKIIRGELPAEKVYEDGDCLAFLDIHPAAKGHLLLIPKAHFIWIQDVPDDLLGILVTQSKRLIKAMIKGLGCEYVQVSIIGKDIPHFHIHLIPRMLNDDVHSSDHQTYESSEMHRYAEKIKAAISDGTMA